MFIRPALCLLAVTLIGLTCCDAQAADESGKKTLDGYLGAGAMSLPKYVGSADQVTRAVPLAMIEYKETIYIQLDRVGVRLWNTDDKKIAFGIAAQPRFGFHANDGARLSGMSTRRDSIEGGAVLEWELPQVSFNVAYFTDWSATSKGQSLHFSMARSKPLTFEKSNIVDISFSFRPGSYRKNEFKGGALTIFPGLIILSESKICLNSCIKA